MHVRERVAAKAAAATTQRSNACVRACARARVRVRPPIVFFCSAHSPCPRLIDRSEEESRPRVHIPRASAAWRASGAQGWSRLSPGGARGKRAHHAIRARGVITSRSYPAPRPSHWDERVKSIAIPGLRGQYGAPDRRNAHTQRGALSLLQTLLLLCVSVSPHLFTVPLHRPARRKQGSISVRDLPHLRLGGRGRPAADALGVQHRSWERGGSGGRFLLVCGGMLWLAPALPASYDLSPGFGRGVVRRRGREL